MKIIEKINELRLEIEEFPDGQTARDIGRLSVEAQFEGLRNGGQWEEYMRKFHTTEEQLDRLMGRDEAWLNAEKDGVKQLGRKALAYILSAGPCLDGTGLRMAAEMPDYLADHLDAGFETDIARITDDKKPDDDNKETQTFVSA